MLQLPVACKTCPCGHSFRKSTDSPASVPVSSPGRAPAAAKEGESPARRRTERVKREKPKFYDASQYERAPRKRVSWPRAEGKMSMSPETGEPRGRLV